MIRICIVRTGALGDVILTLPVIHNLRRAFPQTPVHLVGNPRLLDLARGDNIFLHDINRAIWAPLFVAGGMPSSDLVRQLAGTTRVISYLPDPDGIFAQNLQRLGIPTIMTHPPRPPETEGIHAIDHLLKPLQTLNVPTPIRHPHIHLSPHDRSPLSANLCPPPPTLLMHPGSGGAAKRWPPESFAAVATAISKQTNWNICIATGPADNDLAQRVAAQAPSTVRVLPPLSLRALAALMAACAIYLGNDSGPSHLAAAVGLPAVVLFGPTSPQTWAPRGRSIEIVQAPARLMSSIHPANVTAALLNHISNITP